MKYTDLQPTCLKLYKEKYQLKDQFDNYIDKNIEDTFKRIAKALSDVEIKDKEKYYSEFLWALENGAIPAGRIISNAGAQKYKTSASLINCVVSGNIHDSMDDILTKLHEAGNSLQSGVGIGYNFSTLRPKGAIVSGAGAKTSGPLSFADIYDKMCKTISSAGDRRGAMMLCFDVRHPDIFETIKSKREAGRLNQFNISILITDEFINAVKNDEDWELIFPASKYDFKDIQPGDIVYDYWPIKDDKCYQYNNKNQVACKVYKIVKAREIWNTIMKSTYDFADPGFLLIDKINYYNNLWFCEDIVATNPCSEQGLAEYAVCLLGSINLTTFVHDHFKKEVYFDFDTYKNVIRIFTRMLDNVVEINNLPLKKQRDDLKRKRRHGMGFLGLGSTLNLLGIEYGSSKALLFSEKITKILAIENFRIGAELAKEKGPAPIMNEEFKITIDIIRHQPKFKECIGKTYTGKDLFLNSNYFTIWDDFEDSKEVYELLKEYGSRFSHATSIAPTGTISASFGNNVSNGIEPTFDHYYHRNVIIPGKNTKEKVQVASYELLEYVKYKHKLKSLDHAYEYIQNNENIDLPNYFKTTDSVTIDGHINTVSVVQKWIDSSISKTINVPTNITFDNFKDVYLKGCSKGLKGITTYRFNPENTSGVLIRNNDLKNTQYKFHLDDNSEVILSGDEEIEYEGEITTANNLYDALKHNTYGKF